MRTTGSTVISRDSIVCPRVEEGSKREIKEGPCPLSTRGSTQRRVSS